MANKKTLHLNLKKKWFDMIKSGEKLEEYRDTSVYWCSRFLYFPHWIEADDIQGLSDDLGRNAIGNWKDIQDTLKYYEISFKKFDTITFSNGYSKKRPQFEIELKSIKIENGVLEWGAEKGKYYFVLELGDIVK